MANQISTDRQSDLEAAQHRRWAKGFNTGSARQWLTAVDSGGVQPISSVVLGVILPTDPEELKRLDFSGVLGKDRVKTKPTPLVHEDVIWFIGLNASPLGEWQEAVNRRTRSGNGRRNMAKAAATFHWGTTTHVIKDARIDGDRLIADIYCRYDHVREKIVKDPLKSLRFRGFTRTDPQTGIPVCTTIITWDFLDNE